MNITLNPDGPLDVRATLARYRIWGEDPANRVVGDVFHRVLRLHGQLIAYEVQSHGTVDQPRLEIQTPGAGRDSVATAIAREVRTIFGLDFDLPGFYRMAKADPVASNDTAEGMAQNRRVAVNILVSKGLDGL